MLVMISKFKVVIKTADVTIRVYKGVAIIEISEGVAPVSYTHLTLPTIYSV